MISSMFRIGNSMFSKKQRLSNYYIFMQSKEIYLNSCCSVFGKFNFLDFYILLLKTPKEIMPFCCQNVGYRLLYEMTIL